MCYSWWYYAPTMLPANGRQHCGCIIPQETAVLCCGLEKNGMVRAWHGRDMASVNQTRSHCVNQMGKTHSKPLAARHVRGTAWARHGNGMLCVIRPLCYCRSQKGLVELCAALQYFITYPYVIYYSYFSLHYAEVI